MRAALLLLLLACDEADPCVPMCAAAASLYGDCLRASGLDWPAAGYTDRADFLDACDTWAWEQRALEEAEDASGRTDRACAAREAALTDPEATCDTFTEFDWSGPLSGS